MDGEMMESEYKENAEGEANRKKGRPAMKGECWSANEKEWARHGEHESGRHVACNGRQTPRRPLEVMARSAARSHYLAEKKEPGQAPSFQPPSGQDEEKEWGGADPCVCIRFRHMELPRPEEKRTRRAAELHVSA